MPERVTRQGMRATRFAAARPAVCTLVAMAYDEELAGRIRQLIGSDPVLTEKKMFGGLAFLIRGNMAIAASSEGGAMVRVDPAQSDALVAATKATPMNMRGREMPGWLRVSSDDLRTDDQLAPWVEIGTGYAARYRPSRSPPVRRLQP
jgi:TfoX/Sxy family transcriptional regulator of competence genes